jgi:NAD(P)-dependent dehydrogenase (short-subunit alcohol dehydrogenase family)
LKKIALITGVTGGIGSATARLFADIGWHVIGVDIHKSDMISKDIDHYINADVSNVSESQHVFDEVAKDEGLIDALINNAAIQICKPIIETTPEEWDNIMASNVRSIYLSIKNAHPLMKFRGGSIVNVSSVHAIATSSNIAAYAASKGAILALTRAVAIELANEKINVNAILPGAIDTPMLRSGLKRGHLKTANACDLILELGSRHVMGRIGTPHEVAEAILFLSDKDKSSFITGQSLIIDGGAIARLSTE